MQGFIRSRVISGTRQLCNLRPWQRCCFSQVAQKEDADNGVGIPKMPPFDYTPPPYTGPNAEEILAQRKEYLSPSMFYFYDKPVRDEIHFDFDFDYDFDFVNVLAGLDS